MLNILNISFFFVLENFGFLDGDFGGSASEFVENFKRIGGHNHFLHITKNSKNSRANSVINRNRTKKKIPIKLPTDGKKITFDQLKSKIGRVLNDMSCKVMIIIMKSRRL